jgi:hypothetical protein
MFPDFSKSMFLPTKKQEGKIAKMLEKKLKFLHVTEQKRSGSKKIKEEKREIYNSQ